MVFAAPAEAQTQGKRHVDIGASARLEYNSDVVLNDNRIAGGKGKDDINLSPSLDLDIYLPRATGSLYLRGSLGYVFYNKYTKLNRERINLEGGIDQRLFGECVAHADGEYSRQLSDLGDIYSTVPIVGVIRNTEERKTISADIGCGGAIGLRPSVAVSHAEIRNSTTIRKYADSDTNSITGQLGYSSPAIGVVSVFGRYSDSKYINRPSPTGEDDGVRTYAAGVQLERNVGTRLNFSGSLNYNSVKPYLASVPTFNGIGFDLSAQYRGDLFQLGITGSRAPEPSTLLFVSYDIQTLAGITLTTELAPRLRWNGGFAYRHRSFAPSPLFTNAPRRGSEELYTLNAGLTYQANRHLRFALDGNYSKRSSDDAQLFGYDQKRVSLTTYLSL